MAEEFIVNGGSRSIDDGECSVVGRSLITYAWPPIAFADPGRIRAVVTPPEIDSRYASSCVLSPSMLRNQGCVTPAIELVSSAPASSGEESTPRWECMSKIPGVTYGMMRC